MNNKDLIAISKGIIKEEKSIPIYIGNRLKNDVYREIVNKLTKDGFNYKEMLNIILKLDELIEEGTFTLDLIDN
jgi:hypothetical protein